MEAFEESCRRATSYPCNLVSPNVPQLELETIQENLRQEAPRLFCDDGSASVDILDVERRGPGSYCHFGVQCSLTMVQIVA